MEVRLRVIGARSVHPPVPSPNPDPRARVAHRHRRFRPVADRPPRSRTSRPTRRVAPGRGGARRPAERAPRRPGGTRAAIPIAIQAAARVMSPRDLVAEGAGLAAITLRLAAAMAVTATPSPVPRSSGARDIRASPITRSLNPIRRGGLASPGIPPAVISSRDFDHARRSSSGCARDGRSSVEVVAAQRKPPATPLGIVGG
jgi:hypothetical protein